MDLKWQKKGGVILNIASDLSFISPDNRIYNNKKQKIKIVKPVSYSVVKHGIVGLTRYTATYWSKQKVRCNAIAPGGIKNNQPKNFLNKISKLIPLNRLANHGEYISYSIFNNRRFFLYKRSSIKCRRRENSIINIFKKIMKENIILIAEIGINHNGDISIAKKLIDHAKEAGFDAVKFQKRTIDIVYTQEQLDTPRESPWGTSTREQKYGLEFEKK